MLRLFSYDIYTIFVHLFFKGPIKTFLEALEINISTHFSKVMFTDKF